MADEMMGTPDTNYATEMTLADGELVVLYHDEPMTEDERKAFASLTKTELKFYVTKVLGFKEFKLH